MLYAPYLWAVAVAGQLHVVKLRQDDMIEAVLEIDAQMKVKAAGAYAWLCTTLCIRALLRVHRGMLLEKY